MRLSVLALFIALPAAAYAAAVCPQHQQGSMDHFKVDCAERGQWCDDSITCCGRLQCLSNGFSRVRVTTFALIRVGWALS